MSIEEFINENRDWFNRTPPEDIIKELLKYLSVNLTGFTLDHKNTRTLIILLCINNHFPIVCYYYSDNSSIWTFKVWDMELVSLYKDSGSPAVDLATAFGLNQYIPHLKSLITLEKI